ncbi:hypothetical protein Taro_005761 [Colocasia esculenta]|uniref:Uncharacterized protein n=1 Tax=Colocasia esculenta TaxID=4460 RepID=A0A843TQP6_COLES|nr:hypothetical protein [Colocasia esculenta]
MYLKVLCICRQHWVLLSTGTPVLKYVLLASLYLSTGTFLVVDRKSFSLPRSALVPEPRREVKRGAAAWSSCVGGCVLYCGSLASLYRGCCRQKSVAGEREGWTVCPSVSCLWRWFGCTCGVGASHVVSNGFRSAGSLGVLGRHPTTGSVTRGRTCGETLLLTWLLGVSRGDTWLFLPDLVEVWDVGACVVRLWCHVVALVFRELLFLGGCVPRCYFRIVFDSAILERVVSDLTLVVGHGIALFPLLCSSLQSGLTVTGVCCRTVLVAACSSCIASSVSCEHECLYRELRVAFLQVLELFEFVAYLTGLNSNPSGSSNPWVAARPSGSLAVGPGGRVVIVVASSLVGSECELQEGVAAVVGCACCERGCPICSCSGWFCLGLRVSVCVLRTLREPTCGVAFTGAGLQSAKPVEGVLALCFVCCVAPLVERCDTCLWLLSALCWLVVNSGEVLLKFFFVGSGGRLFRVCFYRLLCYLRVEVVWFGRLVCVLVKVFPRIALCHFWRRFFPGVLGVVLGYRQLLALLVEVLPNVASCCFDCRLSLPLGGDELSLLPVELSV